MNLNKEDAQTPMQQRIKMLVQLAGSQLLFCEKTKIGQAAISSFLNRNDAQLKTGTLELIKIAYPSLNLNWLITGDGEMWQTNISELPKADDTVGVVQDNGKVAVKLIHDIGVHAGTPTEYYGTNDYQVLMIAGAIPGSIAMTVTGHSMAPEVNDGEIVVAHPVALNDMAPDALYILENSNEGFTLKRARPNGPRHTLLMWNDGRQTLWPNALIKGVWKVYKELVDY